MYKPLNMANKLQLNFSGGMNSHVSSLLMRDNECEICLNYHLDKVGTATKRAGTLRFGNQPVASVDINGLYSFVDSSASVVHNLMVGNNSGGTQGVIYLQNTNTLSITAGGSTSILASQISFAPAVQGTPVSVLNAAVSSATASASSVNLSTTVSSGNANRHLVVFVSAATASATPSSVTWNGTPLVQQTAIVGSSSISHAIWSLANPTPGTANVIVTFGGTKEDIIVSSVTIQGASGTFPDSASSNAQVNSATTTSVTGTNSTQEYILGWFTVINTTQTVGPGQTQLINQVTPGGTTFGPERATLSSKIVGDWAAVKTDDTASKKTYFSTFVDYVFRTNGADVVATSPDGATWGTTNAPATITPKYTAVFQDRVYVAHGGASNKSRVWFSSLPSSGAITWTTGSDFFDVNPDDGDEITGIENNGNRLLIFKTRALYRWTFGAVEPDKVIGVGSATQQNIKTNFDRGITFFANQQGVYAYTGDRPKLLSRKVEKFTNAILDIFNAPAEIDADHYYFYTGNLSVADIFGGDAAITGVNRTFVKAMLVYTISLDAWTIYTFADSMTYMARMFPSSSPLNPTNIYFGSSDGRAYQLFTGLADDYTGTNDPIQAEMRTKEYLLNFPNRSQLEWVDIFAEQRTGLNVSYDIDRLEKWANLGALNLRVSSFRVPSRECNSVRVLYEDQSNKTRSIIEGFNLEHEPKEKRAQNVVPIIQMKK